MKVVCINDSGWVTSNRKFLGFKLPDKECDGPAYGDIVTIKSSYYQKGLKYYNLIEWPPNEGDNGYEANCFTPLKEEFEEVKLEQIQERSSVN